MAKRLIFSNSSQETASFSRKLFTDAILLAPGRLAQILGGFAVTVILGKYLSPEKLGVYTLFWLGQLYLALFATGWLQNAAIRFLPENTGYTALYTRLSVVIALAICILGLLITSLVNDLFGETYKSTYFIWGILISSASCFFLVNQGIFRGNFRQLLYSSNNLLLFSSQVLFLIILLPEAADSTNMALMALAVSYLPVLVWQSASLWKMRRSSHSQEVDRALNITLLKRSAIYGLPLTISLLLLNMLQTADRYILVSLLTLRELGIYSFWMKMGLNMSRALSGIAFSVINPRLFQLYASDSQKAETYVLRLLDVYVFIVPPVLTAAGHLLILLLSLFGIKPTYREGSYLIFYGMGMAFLLGLTQLCGKNLEFVGKTTQFMYAAIVGITTMVIACYIFTPHLRMAGAALATLIGFCLYFIMILIKSPTLPNVFCLAIGVAMSGLMMTLFHLVKGSFNDYFAATLMLMSLATYVLLGLRLFKVKKRWRKSVS